MEKSKFRFVGNESNIGDIVLRTGDIIELTAEEAAEAIAGGCGLEPLEPSPFPPAPAGVTLYAQVGVPMSAGDIEDL